MFRNMIFVVFVFVLAQMPMRAQESPAEVLVLGMYHFANPGKDAVKTEVGDILSEEGQQQLAEVLVRLKTFAPTKIAIEAAPAVQSKFDSLYRTYRQGDHTLTRNERQQIGFRLGKDFGHERLYCIDYKEDLPFDAYLTYAKEHDPGAVREFESTIERVTAIFDSLHQHASVLEILQLLNSPSWMAFDHGLYMGMVGVGTISDDIGADVLSTWYDRNIRIFSNLVRITEPGDRILVVYGGGHATILRDLVRAHPSMKLIDAADVLQ